MALTTEEADRLLSMALSRAGCPATVSDRLDAFVAGARSAIVQIMPMVSVDKPKEKERCVEPEERSAEEDGSEG